MKYEEYIDAIGFKKSERGFIKEIDGFKLFLKDWQYVVLTIPSFYIPLDKKLTKEVVNKISKALFDTACSVAPINSTSDMLIVTLPDGKKGSEKWNLLVINQTLESVKILKEEGYGPMKLCPICSLESEYGFLGDNYLPIHKECKKKHLDILKNKIKEDNSRIWICFISILVSLMLSCIGLLPALLLGLYTYDFFTPLVALVPIFNALGYYFIKAPNKKWLRKVMAIIPLLLIVPFGIFILPHMAKGKELDFINYCFSNGWVGFRKIVLMTILSLGGFGTIKFASKFKVDLETEVSKIEK